jgi:hypothetical protein
MDISDQISSGFIKVPDLAGGTRRAVIAEVRPGKYERPDVEFQDGSMLSLNATNLRTLAAAWGTETDLWVGKEVEAYVGKTTYNGKEQDSVLLLPISPPIPLAERPPPKPKPAAAMTPMDDEIPY